MGEMKEMTLEELIRFINTVDEDTVITVYLSGARGGDGDE